MLAFHKVIHCYVTRYSATRYLEFNSQVNEVFSVIKLDIVNRVAENTGVPKALFNAMKEAMQRSERIELRGFGVFVVKPRKRGIGRNPRTGEVTDIPPGKTIRFKPGKEMQQ
jgi:DNA-binding protein HU-beta